MVDEDPPPVPAYTREEYPLIRAASKDWMPDTFEKWNEHFNERCLAWFVATGELRMPRIRIKPGPLEAWLTANNLESTEATRARYAQTVAGERAQLRRDEQLLDEERARKPPYDPTMPFWANRLQARLAIWWARHGLW